MLAPDSSLGQSGATCPQITEQQILLLGQLSAALSPQAAHKCMQPWTASSLKRLQYVLSTTLCLLAFSGMTPNLLYCNYCIMMLQCAGPATAWICKLRSTCQSSPVTDSLCDCCCCSGQPAAGATWRRCSSAGGLSAGASTSEVAYTCKSCRALTCLASHQGGAGDMLFSRTPLSQPAPRPCPAGQTS